MAQSNADNMAKRGENETILDVILEKTANVEHQTNQNTITRLLSEAIRINSKRERALRESTITIKISDAMDKNKIMDTIESKWIVAKKQVPTTFWQDRDHVYCQFVSPDVKNNFLDFVSLTKEGDVIKDNIIKANMDGLHFQRRPIRLEIQNVRANVKTELVKSTLDKLLENIGEIKEFKEGKLQTITRTRGLYFRANAACFTQLFKVLDGSIPYTNRDTNTRVKLFVKINAKPWQCRECFKIGQHSCEGRSCAQCGNKGHTTTDCKSKTKACNNCKRRGHRAKDAHCPYYLNEIAKELRKMDIPLEFLEDTDSRFCLIKHLQLK